MLEDKTLRDALRDILDKAVNKGYLIEQEIAWVDKLFKKIDLEIQRKTNDKLRLDGELNQLNLTKRLVIDIIKDTIAAAERAEVREETFKRMKEGKAARETIVVEKEPQKDETKKKTTRRKREKK